MSNYFRKLPDFNYVSRLPNAKISDYVTVKNLFKRGKLADDVFNALTLFARYQIYGDDRPDNVAHKVYGNSNLDWVVLLSNNILNIQSEWPLLQNDFDRFVLDKYETYQKLNEVHHYETTEVKNVVGTIIVPAGMQCESDYSVTYYDWYAGVEITKSSSDIVVEVTNLEYEEKKENIKRQIFLLKNEYLGIVKDDLEKAMIYKKGSSQYLTETLKEGENIRLYS